MSDSGSNRPPIKDPNAELEAEKYENPVASREALLMLLEQAEKPLTHEDVVAALQETDEDRIEALRRRLIAMCRDGRSVATGIAQATAPDNEFWSVYSILVTGQV